MEQDSILSDFIAIKFAKMIIKIITMPIIIDICDNIELLYYLYWFLYSIISVVLKNVSIVYNISLVHNVVRIRNKEIDPRFSAKERFQNQVFSNMYFDEYTNTWRYSYQYFTTIILMGFYIILYYLYYLHWILPFSSFWIYRLLIDEFILLECLSVIY